jgi:hypothetical protein
MVATIQSDQVGSLEKTEFDEMKMVEIWRG